MEYKWTISKLTTAPQQGNLNNVVVSVNWLYTAKDGDIEVSDFGKYDCASPSDTDFTAYPDLTYEQVCSWLNSGLDTNAIDLGLDVQIENIINPPLIVLPLPWVTPAN